MPNESRNPSTNAFTVHSDLLRAFHKLLYLQFFVLSDQWKNTVWQRFFRQFERHFYTRVTLIIIPIKIVKNSLLFSCFVHFKETKTRINFWASWSLGKEKLSFFWLQWFPLYWKDMPNSKEFHMGISLLVISVRIVDSCR